MTDVSLGVNPMKPVRKKAILGSLCIADLDHSPPALRPPRRPIFPDIFFSDAPYLMLPARADIRPGAEDLFFSLMSGEVSLFRPEGGGSYETPHTRPAH